MANKVSMTFQVDTETHLVGWDGKSELAVITKNDIDGMIAELARRDEQIAELEAMIDPDSFRKYLVRQLKDPELASAYVKATERDTAYDELLARRDEIIARLKEDGERLRNIVGYPDEQVAENNNSLFLACKYCGRIKVNKKNVAYIISDSNHAPDCPITLHRQLMDELGNLPR